MQDALGHGLADVVVHAGGDALLHFAFGGGRRERHDGDCVRDPVLLAQEPGGFEAVHDLLHPQAK